MEAATKLVVRAGAASDERLRELAVALAARNGQLEHALESRDRDRAGEGHARRALERAAGEGVRAPSSPQRGLVGWRPRPRGVRLRLCSTPARARRGGAAPASALADTIRIETETRWDGRSGAPAGRASHVPCSWVTGGVRASAPTTPISSWGPCGRPPRAGRRSAGSRPPSVAAPIPTSCLQWRIRPPSRRRRRRPRGARRLARGAVPAGGLPGERVLGRGGDARPRVRLRRSPSCWTRSSAGLRGQRTSRRRASTSTAASTG